MGNIAVITMAVVFSFAFAYIALAEEESSGKMIELILDCSGSMNAVMPGGVTRIDAAREAVSKVVNSLPADTQLAFRAYGHQSAREKQDCSDTSLLVPFGSLTNNKATIISHTNQLQARGYTPITKVLQVAADDFPTSSSGERMIILVSDGKETCAGDPCAAARSLTSTGVKLVIHTVGFTVDDATRFQLKCIAQATGGTYFDAENSDQLTQVINQAVIKKTEKILIEKSGVGKLQVNNVDMAGHKVTDAVTGKEVAQANPVTPTVELPAGLYNVTFGAGVWKSVQVENGKTTVLEPGALSLSHIAMSGHKVTDSETGVSQGDITPIRTSMTLLPGVYDVSFGPNFVWFGVTVKSGNVTKLNPGVVKVSGISPSGHKVYTSGNKEIGKIDYVMTWLPLPPGDYFIDMNEKKTPFKLVEGQEMVFEVKTK